MQFTLTRCKQHKANKRSQDAVSPCEHTHRQTAKQADIDMCARALPCIHTHTHKRCFLYGVYLSGTSAMYLLRVLPCTTRCCASTHGGTRQVPAKLIAIVLPAALQALPTDIVPIVISAALRGSPKSPAVTSSAPSVRKTEVAWASSVIVSAAHHCHKPGRPLNEVNWASSVIGAVLETLPDLPDLPEIIPHILAALPVERLPDLAPAVMRAVPAEQIATVLPGALQVLPPTIATAVVKAVLLKLPEARLPELAPAVLRSVPKQLVPAVPPHALQALPIDLIPRIVSATLRPSSVSSVDPPNVFEWARFASVAVAAKLVTELSVGGAVPTETGGSANIPSARIVELQSLSHSREVALHESIAMIATMGEKIVEMTGRMQEHIAEVIKVSGSGGQLALPCSASVTNVIPAASHACCRKVTTCEQLASRSKSYEKRRCTR